MTSWNDWNKKTKHRRFTDPVWHPCSIVSYRILPQVDEFSFTFGDRTGLLYFGFLFVLLLFSHVLNVSHMLNVSLWVNVSLKSAWCFLLHSTVSHHDLHFIQNCTCVMSCHVSTSSLCNGRLHRRIRFLRCSMSGFGRLATVATGQIWFHTTYD